jgi:tRNA (cytidine/uridine-2'-O-)-methyltransferase
MLNIVLVEPEIPPNTGNIIRLCANTGAQLHLVEPLGFPLEDTRMKRAGLDYHEYANMKVHPNWQAFLNSEQPNKDRVFAITTKGKAKLSEARFQENDYLVFGSETKGLDPCVREYFLPERCLRLPMRANSRSLNLSNAVAVMVYEAWRQMGFVGGE